MAEEDVLGESVVEQSPSSSDHGSPLTSNVVGKANARRKVVVILVIQLIGRRQVSCRIRIELVEEVVFLSNDSEIIPAHTIIHGQARRPAEAVLEI